MLLKEFTAALNGPIWSIFDFEIEGLDVTHKVEDDPDGSSSSVSIKNLPVSGDNILNVFIKVGAPNGTVYDVVLSGQTDEQPSRKIEFKQKGLTVVKNGKLVILIDKNIDDLTA
jgi:hypothetical protein